MTEVHSNSAPMDIYGSKISYYTGKLEAYLRYKGLPYTLHGMPYDKAKMLKAKVGAVQMPIGDREDGRWMSDTTPILLELEKDQLAAPILPEDPVIAFIARLIEDYGDEWLWRAAMHYRWSFEAENLDYLVMHFEMLMPPGEQGAVMARKAADKMRGATRAFGVNADTIPMVEEVYAEALAAMDAQFAEVPYLLGGRPCIGDFGIYAPMFGHLGRDPKPLMMMQAKALRVFRWVERMGRETSDTLEFQDRSKEYLADDAIPETLIDLLRALSVDFMPETLAAADTINAWIEANNPEVGAPCERMLGFASFEVRGTPVSAVAQPYRFYLLARAQAEREAMDAATRAELDAMLERAGMSALIEAKLTRAMGFKDNREVWL